TLLIPDRGFRAAPRVSTRAQGVVLAASVLLLVSAASPERIDDFVRQGNAAFAREQFDEALKHYAQAETLAGDPGLVAFNKAACLYRLKQYGQASQYYRACLEDQRIPPAREARALYDLGNCLVRQDSTHAALLEEAVDCYRRCIAHAETSDELRVDAAQNLDIAKRLWLKARANAPDPPP